MEIEFLHTLSGDKRRSFDTSTPEARQETQGKIRDLLRKGNALILERGKKSYYVTGYDAGTNSYTVSVSLGPRKGDRVRKTRAKVHKGKATAVPHVGGGCVGA